MGMLSVSLQELIIFGLRISSMQCPNHTKNGRLDMLSSSITSKNRLYIFHKISTAEILVVIRTDGDYLNLVPTGWFQTKVSEFYICVLLGGRKLHALHGEIHISINFRVREYFKLVTLFSI